MSTKITETDMCYIVHNYIEGIDYLSFQKLSELYGGTENAFDSLAVTEETIIKALELKEQNMKNGIHYASYLDKEYPALLQEIYDKPMGIFYKGVLPDEEAPALGMVGARECTLYGKQIAKDFATFLSYAGIQIISGLAKGIDGYSHEGAIEGGQRTYAVLGGGVDVIYPQSNSYLYKRILDEGGGIISEYFPGTKPRPEYFPKRNRIISGLTKGVLVVEAKIRSGSLITTHYAIEQNREVYAIPGRINDRYSSGCNDLIKQGAKLVERPEDILSDEVFQNYHYCKNEKKTKFVLETTEKMVYDCLRCHSMHLGDIMKQTNLSCANVLKALISLEQKHLCIQIAPNHYAIREVNGEQ